METDDVAVIDEDTVEAAVGAKYPESYGGINTPRNNPIEPTFATMRDTFVAVL